MQLLASNLLTWRQCGQIQSPAMCPPLARGVCAPPPKAQGQRQERHAEKDVPTATDNSRRTALQPGEAAQAYLCFSISALISSGGEERKAC